jgi:hypothetical protein
VFRATIRRWSLRICSAPGSGAHTVATADRCTRPFWFCGLCNHARPTSPYFGVTILNTQSMVQLVLLWHFYECHRFGEVCFILSCTLSILTHLLFCCAGVTLQSDPLHLNELMAVGSKNAVRI